MDKPAQFDPDDAHDALSPLGEEASPAAGVNAAPERASHHDTPERDGQPDATAENELEELRGLLLRREQEQIRALEDRLDDKERRVRETAGALPLAVKLSRERGEDFNRAMQPTVEDAVRISLEERPQAFIDALLPHIGLLVRRSIAESLRGLVQSINQTLEHTFSVQGLKWRYEAVRTGRSFAEVVMLHSMVYRVEDVFLIHRQTSLTLLHVSSDGSENRDSDLVAGMLSAIRDFARDAMKAGAEDALDEFRVGELEVWIANGQHAYLAAAIRGTPPRGLRAMLEETIDNIHILKGVELARFDGDAAVFEPLRPDLEACLRVQYRQGSAAGGGKRGSGAKMAVAASLAAAVVFFLAFLAVNAARRWGDFRRRLGAEPGIVVTTARHGWFGPSRVEGLRDPLAADPAKIARAAGVDAGGVRFGWKPYFALDPVSVRRRFEARFPLPPGVRLAVGENGAATLGGSAPYEWLERVRREGGQTPGVSAVVEAPDLAVTYDPAPALARFRQAYPPPAGVEARVTDDGALALSGKAPYEWLAPVREGAVRLPGIRRVDETALRVAFDPALSLQRFEGKFSVPDTVNATVREADGALVLTGEASHRWLERVRRQAAGEVPGIASVDARGVTDVDQRAFQQSKSVIESAFVYFLPNKDNFATEGFAALSRLPEEIRQCQTAAQRIGQSISIAVLGSADGMGPEAKNLELSRRRAQAVTDFLVSCGFEAGLFQPTGLGAPASAPAAAPTSPAAGGLAGAKAPSGGGEQSQRRVAFRVDVSLSSSPR